MASQQQTSTTPEADRDRWRTPAWLFAFLSARFGPFGIDLAAEETNALCDEFFTREDNALGQAWAGLNCFANPPFSSPGAWVEKAVIEADLGASTTIVLHFRAYDLGYTRTVWVRTRELMERYG